MRKESSGLSMSTGATVFIVLAFLIYVASPGPVMYLQIKGIVPSPPPDWVCYFYRPYVWVQRTHLLDGWDAWWINRGNREHREKQARALKRRMEQFSGSQHSN